MPRQSAKFKRGDTRLSKTGVRRRYDGKQWQTKCADDGCIAQPIFNFEGESQGVYCDLHKKDGMINVKERRICTEDGCKKKRPAFNFEGESQGVYCDLHKKDGMLNVTERRICREDGCKKRPNFNFEGESQGLYCSEHKKDGMIDVKNRRCAENGCMKQPAFNFEGESQGLYCSEHKKDGMLNVKNRRCAEDGCIKYPCFNNEGESQGVYCDLHKKDGMLNVTERTICREDGCKKIPAFNNEGESQGLYCFKHKKDGMIDVISRRCAENGCMKRPNFNNEGESQGLYCSEHKKDGMIDVKNRRCAEDGCMKQPGFNFKGESQGLYCSKHKKDGMIDVKSRRCAEDGCMKRPAFNFEGESHGLYCSEHKKDGMIDFKHRRCEYDCCIFLETPSLAMFKNYFYRNQPICWAAAKNQMYDETLTIQEREAIGNYYGFGNINLVLRQEQCVMHLINSTEIGKTLRTNSFGHSFDTDPIRKIFGKNKNVEHKKPDYCVLVNKYSIIVIEYDENSSHEKSRARLNQIKDMFHLNVKEEIRNMELYTESSVSSSSTSSVLKNIHIIRINGRDDDNEKRVCIKRERKETEGEYTYIKRYYELSDHGLTVVMEATLLLEEIYNQILLDSDDDAYETELQIHEIN